MTTQLVGADYTQGALLPNYVNGRLLVAEDLATEQNSLRTRDTRIGEAAGAGIVRGMWVTGSAATVTVSAGLAIAHTGAPVVLSESVTLQLAFAAAAPSDDASQFTCCTAEPAPGQTSPLTSGIYVLTARPACRLEGSAPLASAPGTQLSPCCVAQWRVEGVEFRAVALPVGEQVAGIKVTTGNIRNLVAHWCFGTEQLLALGQDPFRFDPSYGGLDDLDPDDLTPYDVPMAVFRWDDGSVVDLDNWSVRRRVTDPDPVLASWSVTTCDRRVADGQARFLQFQDQAEELVSQSLARSARAGDHFGLLPPVGFLPVVNTQLRGVADNRLQQTVAAYQKLIRTQPAAVVRDEVRAEWAARGAAANVGAAEKPGAATDTSETAKRVAELATLEADRAYYQQIVDFVDISVGYGFDPSVFFRGLGRFGGVLTWDLAEWALQQSWRVQPVSTDLSVGLQAAALELVDRAAVILPQRLTYYYVLENIEAAQAALLLQRSSVTRFAKLVQRPGFIRSNLYVVFIANQRWVNESIAPYISYRLGGLPGGD